MKLIGTLEVFCFALWKTSQTRRITFFHQRKKHCYSFPFCLFFLKRTRYKVERYSIFAESSIWECLFEGYLTPYELTEDLLTWPRVQLSRRVRGLNSKRERKWETERKKKGISFRGGVYILPSAKALNSCHKDIHTHTHTPFPTEALRTIMVSFSQFKRNFSPTP